MSRPRAPAPPSWDDEPTIVWSPPDWDPEDGKAPEPSPVAATPPENLIEVDVREIPSSVALGSYARRAYEIWTKNRIYALNAQLECIEVIDLATGQSAPNHPFIGARAAGGQLRSERENSISFPLPVPGGEAVFQRRDAQSRIRLSITSRVVRVVMHVHRVSIATTDRDGAWKRITRY